MYNPKEYWKNELGGVENWKHDADTSPNIVRSIDRLRNVVIPTIVNLKQVNGGNILDAGCGCGYCANEFNLSNSFNNVYGIDFQIIYAKK